MKRLFDIAIAGCALAATSPLLAVLAAAVKLESPGPALFSQVRVGRGGKPFQIYKLRTMRTGVNGAQVTAAGDSRITRAGRILRKTKLDELPQLWNVLRGDMSIVGPRPEVPKYVELYRPEWRRLLDVRPGLTDVASLRFRDEERVLGHAQDRERAYAEVIMPLKLALALEGVQRVSILADLHVIADTALAIIRRSAAEDPIVDEALRRIELLNREVLS